MIDKLLKFSIQYSTTEFSRLWALRTFFYGLLAYDLIAISFKHAARYGIDGFNVSHISFLDPLLPLPTPHGIATLWVLCAFLSLLAAFNVHTRFTVRAVAVLYGGVYLWSQIDSYQHHYLNATIAFVLALIPSRYWSLDKAPPRGSIQSAGIGILFIQFALVYFWTAIAKIDTVWMSGATLASIAHGDQLLQSLSFLSELLYGAQGDPILNLDALYQTLSSFVIIGEFLAALLILIPRLRWMGMCLAPMFHLSVEFLGLDIELFSVYMIGFNLILLSPKVLWTNCGPAILRARRLVTWANHTKAVLLLAGVGGTFSAWLSLGTPAVYGTSVLHASILSITTTALILLSIRESNRGHGMGWAIVGICMASTLMPIALTETSATYDYHRMLGGDLSRRLPSPKEPQFNEKLQTAIDVYAMANKAAPFESARRTKLAQLALKSPSEDRLALAQSALTSGYSIHLKLIDELERRLSLNTEPRYLEDLIRTQQRLARLCQTFLKLPLNYQNGLGPELQRTLTEMKLSSERNLTELTGRSKATVRTELVDTLANLAKDGRYNPSTDALIGEASVPKAPNCSKDVQKMAEWSILRSQMRLGRKDPLDPARLRVSSSKNCKVVLSYPVESIIQLRLRSMEVSALQRDQRRVFRQ